MTTTSVSSVDFENVTLVASAGSLDALAVVLRDLPVRVVVQVHEWVGSATDVTARHAEEGERV